MTTPFSWSIAKIIERMDDCVILDTETTGFTGEIIDLAILSGADGSTLFNSLIKHSSAVEIEPGAAAVHHITEAHIAAAPTFADTWPDIEAAIYGKMIIAYNAEFDMTRFEQSARAAQIAPALYRQSWTCAMLAYATYWGEPNRRGYWSPAWQKLDAACAQQGIPLGQLGQQHRALSDCTLTYNLLRTIAERSASGQPAITYQNRYQQRNERNTYEQRT